MFAGLPFGKMTISRLCKNVRCVPLTIKPDPIAAFISFVLAAAKTSAVAPCSSCVRSCCDPAKLKVTLMFGWSALKADPISVKASVNEDAAKTVSVIDPLGADWPVGAQADEKSVVINSRLIILLIILLSSET